MTIYFIENEEEEKKFDIFLWTYQDSHHLWVDTYITPVFCTGCNKQLTGMYAFLDSHQGQVGTLLCDHCAAVIVCTDRDLFHHELWMGTGHQSKFHLEYGKLYSLHPKIFSQVEKETGFNLYAKGRKVRLSRVIEELCTLLHLPLSQIPRVQILTDLHFHHMPLLVNQWLNLLRYLRLT